MNHHHRKIEEASDYCGVPREMILLFIKREWISPLDQETPILDEEDVARVLLIWELRQNFGVNDEAIPIILNLIDQINLMHLELKKFRIH
ncbi:MAG: chaperone modulator CbpM [Bacteriovoracaceae bacterium]|nr:chaperone modulator CbpM [Bacteriovoracaceae bacterium]